MNLEINVVVCLILGIQKENVDLCLFVMKHTATYQDLMGYRMSLDNLRFMIDLEILIEVVEKSSEIRGKYEFGN